MRHLPLSGLLLAAACPMAFYVGCSSTYGGSVFFGGALGEHWIGARRPTPHPGFQELPQHNSNGSDLERLGSNRFRVSLRDFAPPSTPAPESARGWNVAAEAVLRHAKVDSSGAATSIQGGSHTEARLPESLSNRDLVLLPLSMAPELRSAHSEAKAASERNRERRSGNPPLDSIWNDFQPALPDMSDAIGEMLQGGLVVCVIDSEKGGERALYLVDQVEFCRIAQTQAASGQIWGAFVIQALDPLTGNRVVLEDQNRILMPVYAGGRSSALNFAEGSVSGYRRACWQTKETASGSMLNLQNPSLSKSP